MSVLFIAVPLAVLLAGSGLCAFVWATRRGQLDDLETPPLRMLLDDDVPAVETAGLPEKGPQEGERR